MCIDNKLDIICVFSVIDSFVIFPLTILKMVVFIVIVTEINYSKCFTLLHNPVTKLKFETILFFQFHNFRLWT